MKRIFTVSLLAATLLAITGIAQAQDTSVRIATNTPYLPMEYLKPDGTFAGFDIDLGNALCKQAKLECSWVDQSWNGIIPGLMARKYDAIMSSMTINDQRKKQVLFSNPYIVVPSSFFVPTDSSLKAPDEQSLKGTKIGVQRGTVQDNYVTDKYGSVATIKRYANADDVAVDMDAGRLDAAFFDQITGQSTLIDKQPDAYRLAGDKLTKPEKYFGTGFGMAFRKNQQELADKFNEALATLKSNGTYDKIYQEYFGKDSSASQSE